MSDRGAGLRSRVALTLAVAAAVAATATAWIFLAVVRQAGERRIERMVERRIAAVERVLAGRAQRLASALDRLEAELTGPGDDLLRRLQAGGPAVVGAAGRLMSLVGTDLLTVLDPRGTVVSSGHWPERAGLTDPSLLALVPGLPVLRRVREPGGTLLATMLRREVEQEGRRLSLVAGVRFDDSFAREVADGDAAVVFDFDDESSSPVIAPGSSGPDLAVCARLAREAAPEHRAAGIAGRPAGSRWSVGRHELRDDEGRALGAVVVGVDRADAELLLGRLRVGFLILGAALTLGAALAGARIARGVTRPVDRLVRAVDAIAAGEADYTFPRTPRDELEKLEAAFSRLQRSLEFQKQRSLAAERVAAWREVARRVAHEVKNPLAPIRLTVENLMRARRRDPRLFDELFEEGAKTILEEVEQLGRLVREFSEFARLPRPALRPVDLQALIDGVIELYAAEPGLEVVRASDGPAPVLDLDPEQVGRALKNIVGNAVEAMRDGPRGRRRLEVRTSVQPGWVEIELCDSGPGLAPDADERIFEPYFTTKSRGTGLGMAIASRIIIEHGGVVSAGNRPEGGARIAIRLPFATQVATGAASAQATPAAVRPDEAEE